MRKVMIKNSTHNLIISIKYYRSAGISYHSSVVSSLWLKRMVRSDREKF